MLLKAKFLVKCPKTGLDVDAAKDCDGVSKCRYFKHTVFEGGIKAYVCCSYGEPEEKPKEVLR